MNFIKVFDISTTKSKVIDQLDQVQFTWLRKKSFLLAKNELVSYMYMYYTPSVKPSPDYLSKRI